MDKFKSKSMAQNPNPRCKPTIAWLSVGAQAYSATGPICIRSKMNSYAHSKWVVNTVMPSPNCSPGAAVW